MDNPKLLKVNNLVTRFDTPKGVVHAVNGISFELEQGETLGIVGESGCGKTVTVQSVLRLIPSPPGRIEAGEAYFSGRDLFQLNLEDMRRIRGRQIGMVFQDTMSSLNPVLTIGRQITEPFEEHLGLRHSEAKERAVELLEQVGIPEARTRLNDFPHQYSGGMRQRVMIAMAIACTPRLLIADEPTTALDVTIQAQIIKVFKRLRQEFAMSVIWITHDLGVIAEVADRVAVFYAGFVVEEASVKRLYAAPQHPYTRGLLESLPRVDKDADRLKNIEGFPPDMLAAPVGCPFGPRCEYVIDRCWSENPKLVTISEGHRAACWWDVERGEPRNV